MSASSLQLRHGDSATGSSTGSALTAGPTLHSLGLTTNFLNLGSGAPAAVPTPDKPRPIRIIVSDVKALCTLELRDAFIAVFMHLGSAFTTGLTRRGKVRKQNVEAVRAAATEDGGAGSGGAGRRSAASSTVPEKPFAAILAEEFELLRQIKEQSAKEKSAAAEAAAEAAMQEGKAGEEEEDSPR